MVSTSGVGGGTGTSEAACLLLGDVLLLATAMVSMELALATLAAAAARFCASSA